MTRAVSGSTSPAKTPGRERKSFHQPRREPIRPRGPGCVPTVPGPAPELGLAIDSRADGTRARQPRDDVDPATHPGRPWRDTRPKARP
jgi:hypothetical protein